MSEKRGPPFEESLDGDIVGRYGYADGRVELAIRLPFPLSTVKKEWSKAFTEAEFARFRDSVNRISKWYDLPVEERKRLGAP